MKALLARVSYTVVLYLASPFVWLYLLYRSRRQPAYRQHWAERLGYYGPKRPPGALIWIHAVSVGETRAAQSLVLLILQRLPDVRIVFTHMTPTGRDTSAALFQGRVESVYLPYDFPGSVRRFVAHFRPALGIMMEMEVWPNLVRACTRAHVPVVLVNARLSERSFARAQRYRALLQPALAQLRCVLAQTEADRQRLDLLGAKDVKVAGNLKFDTTVEPALNELGALFAVRVGERQVVLAAQTRDGEEALLVTAWRDAALPKSWLLVIVPRHPQRFDSVAHLVAAAGFVVQRRSDNAAVLPATDVWLGDSMGEMLAYYSIAPVAFIGGSLLPFGAHNLIEATAIGCPVAIGPYTFNFTQATDDAIATGAALRVTSAADFLALAQRLVHEPHERARMSERAAVFARSHRGATERTYAALLPWLPNAAATY